MNDTVNSEELAPGLRREWIDDGTIVVYILTSTSHETIDRWAEVVMSMIREWSPDKPYLVAHDATAIMMTPYLRQRSEEIAQMPRVGVAGYYAVVLSETAVGELMKQFVQRNLERNTTGRDPVIFTSREKAVDWLREMRDKSPEDK